MTDTPHFGAEENQHIRWHGVFASREWEDRFRDSELADDVKRVRLLMVVAITGTLAYIPNDYYFFGAGPSLTLLLAFRLAVIGATFFVMWLLRRNVTPRFFDRWVMTWSLLVAASMIVVAYTRPPNFTGHIVVNLITILITYWALPLPALGRAVSGWFLSLGVLAMCLTNPQLDSATCLTVFLSILTVNLLGGEIARENQISQRKQFLAFTRQMELSDRLERAMGEIKTLRGILPICMHCKKIWNDGGFWEQLETYVCDHTHAEFTHGLCPECMRSQYPEIDWEKKRLIDPPVAASSDSDERPA